MTTNIFYYRKAVDQGVFPGAHSGKNVGNGLLFKHLRPFISAPDPRHIDLRASLLNPYSQFQVKVFQQLSRLDVFLIADLSASMRYRGQDSKSTVIIDCLHSVAQSAFASGDRFGFIGCGQTIQPQLLISPASPHQGRISATTKILQASTFTGKAESVLQTINYLPSQSALVFWLSDFHIPLSIIQQQMQQLNQHFVVPLVLWDTKESSDLPEWGIVKFSDLELNKTRTLFMRPQLRKKIRTAFEQRKRTLRQCFRRFGCEPLFIEQGYRAELVTDYFLRYAG